VACGIEGDQIGVGSVTDHIMPPPLSPSQFFPQAVTGLCSGIGLGIRRRRRPRYLAELNYKSVN
jgi:hypothetical protein